MNHREGANLFISKPDLHAVRGFNADPWELLDRRWRLGTARYAAEGVKKWPARAATGI
jgi:hypothetical protein